MSEGMTAAPDWRDDPKTRPVIRLAAGRSRRVEGGHPWVYSNEIELDAAAKALPAGTLVSVTAAEGRPLGSATFNPHALIALRIMERDPTRPIDAAFFASKLNRALDLRRRLLPENTDYRLVHAEADGLPGLVIDRYRDIVACQLNTAGMTRMLPPLAAALKTVLNPRTILAGNDATGRQLEQLDDSAKLIGDAAADPVRLHENGLTYLASLTGGQKTGWYFDQRSNRALVASLATDSTMLDVFSYAGGFGLLAAARGATRVMMVDRSAEALRLAEEAARLHGLEGRVETRQGIAFDILAALAEDKQRFDVVVLDPPPFARSKKDIGPAIRAYRKLVRLGAAVATRRGFLFVACCSHNVTPEMFADAVRQGLHDAGRPARLLASAGAAPDHPVHPAVPESAYLKSALFALD